jgi:hypothetical protein
LIIGKSAVPASASLSIAAVVDHVGGVERPDPVVLAPDLRDVLGSVVDPRKRRGVRHPLAVVLTVVVCAVVAGARSFVAVAEWAADLPDELAQILDTDRRRPSESSRPRRSPDHSSLRLPSAEFVDFGGIAACRSADPAQSGNRAQAIALTFEEFRYVEAAIVSSRRILLHSPSDTPPIVKADVRPCAYRVPPEARCS